MANLRLFIVAGTELSKHSLVLLHLFPGPHIRLPKMLIIPLTALTLRSANILLFLLQKLLCFSVKEYNCFNFIT